MIPLKKASIYQIELTDTNLQTCPDATHGTGGASVRLRAGATAGSDAATRPSCARGSDSSLGVWNLHNTT